MRNRSALILLTLSLLAQSPSPPRMVSGIVVDVGGRPVAGARIEHGKTPIPQSTGSDGRFEFETAAPAVVIRKAGFLSRFLPTENATGVRVVLEPAHPVPPCALDSVPKHSTKTSKDIDYVSTAMVIKTANGRAAVVCGKGPLWSFGIPSDFLVWKSIEYYEIVTAENGGTVDARGKTGDGKYWRYRGVFGNSCEYSQVDRTTAAALDCLMGRKPER